MDLTKSVLFLLNWREGLFVFICPPIGELMRQQKCTAGGRTTPAGRWTGWVGSTGRPGPTCRARLGGRAGSTGPAAAGPPRRSV